MRVIAIVGSSPKRYLPDLTLYEAEVDIWIGADRGALALVEHGITVDYALGDFDSVTAGEKLKIIEEASHIMEYTSEKEATDLEIALQKARKLKADKIYLFGVTGGRLDHALINMQFLYTLIGEGVRGMIVDYWNQVELMKPGTYTIAKNELYPYISFVPFTERVRGISLTGFFYSLEEYDVAWGSTRLISNELVEEIGELSFAEGMLLFVQSRDVD